MPSFEEDMLTEDEMRQLSRQQQQRFRAVRAVLKTASEHRQPMQQVQVRLRASDAASCARDSVQQEAVRLTYL